MTQGWNVLRALRGSPLAIGAELDRLGFTPYVPVELTRKFHDRNGLPTMRKRPLVGAYVFVRPDPRPASRLIEARGFKAGTMISAATQVPLIVPDYQISILRLAEAAQHQSATLTPKTSYIAPGVIVEAMRGILRGTVMSVRGPWAMIDAGSRIVRAKVSELEMAS